MEKKQIEGTDKEEFKQALKERRVLVVGVKYTSKGWVGFRVFIVTKDCKIKELTGGSAWRKVGNTYCYYTNVFGSDRVLKIILSIANDLGLKFDEVKQDGYIWLSY